MDEISRNAAGSTGCCQPHFHMPCCTFRFLGACAVASLKSLKDYKQNCSKSRCQFQNWIYSKNSLCASKDG